VFSRFFIDRPIFAAVLSITITLTGAIAAFRLPVAQYPQIAPPTVQVDCNYPGASSQTVAESIAAPIEQEVNGVEGMMYMSSQCTSDGSYTLTVTFEPGTDLNMAQVLVQNRINLAMPRLPDVVKATGVNLRKRSPELLLTVSINSPNETYNQLYLSNYALTRLRDELARIPGIADILLFGQRDYSMRVWLDPHRLAARGLVPSDVTQAIREQNQQVALGTTGQGSGPDALQIPISTTGRLGEIEDFENIIIKKGPRGELVRVKDVATVKFAARSEDVTNRFDMKPTIGIAVFLLSNANALEVADQIKEKMKELSADFPDDLVYEIGYDTTPFIRESIKEVFVTLGHAILLVAIVVLVFLQNWRSALIPLIAVPVAIIGTFGALAVAGFTINNLTLFGLVLAIGIVVDDAIVVVEAVEHHIAQGMQPREATIKAMQEVSGPVFAVGVVLSAVFIPCAFVPGIEGQFYRQFALTIAISTIISMFNSLTLSPALAALLLKRKGAKPDFVTVILNFLLGWFFRLFNAAFNWSSVAYGRAVSLALRGSMIVLLLYGGLLLLTGWGLKELPRGFIPQQDKGYLIASVQLPDSASSQRTRSVMAKIAQISLEEQGVHHVNSVAGNSFVLSAYGSNFGSMFIILDDFGDRRNPKLHGEEIAARLRKRFAEEIPEANVTVFSAPPVSGLGRSGGFRLMIEDRGDATPKELQGQVDNLAKKGNEEPEFAGLFTVFRANAPQVYVDVDREECWKQGIELQRVFDTLRIYLGAYYVNDFNKFGRTWQVVVQGDARYRNDVEDIKSLRVRNNKGDMVPMASIATVKETTAPQVLTRYNMYPAAYVSGNTAPGVSTGQATTKLEKLADDELPSTMSYEWTEIAYIEKRSGNTGMVIFGLSVLTVFLVLAALYESWTLPLAVILVVPMCVFGSLVGVWMANHDINIFTQIGFVVLIGLACKNAILIVEFAKLKRDEGVPAREATLEACKLRLRPILMTSFAFILGVVPLVFATGAGAEMRKTLGTAVFAGMIGVTMFGIFLTPVFFYVIDRISHWGIFASPIVRLPADWTLAVLSLRPLRHGVRWGWQQVQKSTRNGP